ncbi:hypothetical protein PMIN04_001505 [Paraphaeosphaeria minitans]
MSEANTTYTNKLILAPAYNARSPTAKMAKLSESQSASLPSRKSNRPGKLELSTSQVLLLTFTLLTLPLLLQALYNTYLTPHLAPLHAPQNDSNTSLDPSSPSLLPACRAHTYTTQIVSLDPLMIYINNFTSSAEAEALIKLGADDFEDSFISRPSGGTQKASGRTSQSAPLAIEEPLVECIVARARAFLGTMLHAHERFSTPQLVRYFPTQRYDLHTDFWPRHQRLSDGSGRLFNRPASFFVFLRDNCTDGETYFPGVGIEEGKEVGFGGCIHGSLCTFRLRTSCFHSFSASTLAHLALRK